MTTDNISPPGAWQEEMNRMPWRYSQQVQVEQALAAIRGAGLHIEAQVLAIEITTLKNEIKDLRNAIGTTR